jgi:hypothetical protein
MEDTSNMKDTSNIEDTNEKFYEYYKSFLKDIILSFPELKEDIRESHASLLKSQYPISEKKRAKCGRFRKKVYVYLLGKGAEIGSKDSKLFLNEDSNENLANDIDFKEIWESSISDSSREQLWNYVQTFYMLAVSEKTNKDLSSIFKNLDSTMKGSGDIDLVNNLKSVTENMTKAMEKKKEEGIEEIGDVDSMKTELDGIMGNTFIGKLAEDISKDLNIEEMVNSSNPADMMSGLLGGDDSSGNLMGLIDKIGDNINSKVGSGEINHMQLLEEAQGMLSNLQSSPLFGNLMEGMGGMGGMGDLSSMQASMAAMQATQATPTSNPLNPTQERLQKKLKKKQNDK